MNTQAFKDYNSAEAFLNAKQASGMIGCMLTNRNAQGDIECVIVKWSV